jgi:hypothetical protein
VVTPAPTLTTLANAAAPVRRSIRKPVSSLELSAHARSTRAAPAAVAVSPPGAAGGAGRVVADASFE